VLLNYKSYMGNLWSIYHIQSGVIWCIPQCSCFKTNDQVISCSCIPCM